MWCDEMIPRGTFSGVAVREKLFHTPKLQSRPKFRAGERREVFVREEMRFCLYPFKCSVRGLQIQPAEDRFPGGKVYLHMQSSSTQECSGMTNSKQWLESGVQVPNSAGRRDMREKAL